MKKIIYITLLSVLLLTNKAFSADDQFAPIYFDEETGTLFGQTSKDEVYALDNYAESLQSVGSNVDVISRKDIERQNTPSLTDLLNQTGSVTVQNANGSDGSSASVRIRGTDRVRMTIDGIRADRPSLTTPGIEPQFFLMDDIEQIEVIKGPQGNVSGTNASGGLIALRTRRGRGPMSIEFGSDFGNYGSFRERFAIMGGNKKADYYVSTTWYKTNGGMRTSDLGEIRNDDYNNLSVVANLGMRLLKEKAELRNVFRFSRARKGLGYGSNSAYPYPYNTYQDPNNYSRNIDIMESLVFRHAPTKSYNYDVKFGLYHNQYNHYGLPDNTDPYYRSLSDISSTRINFGTQQNIKYKEWNTFSIGYNFETESIGGSDFANSTLYDPMMWAFPYTDHTKYSGSTIQNDIFVNDLINIKDILFIRGGARFIQNSQYGCYITPNVSAALVLPTFKLAGAKTKLRGSWGQSVNTPTLYQRYGTMNYMGAISMVGNPDLKAERFQSWDVGIEQSFMDNKLRFEFGYFNSDYNNYISYISDDITWIGKYVNIDRAQIQGYEAKASWEPNDKFKIVLNYTYTDSKDKATGYELPAVPRNRLNGTIYYTPFERWTMYFGLEAGSERKMAPSANKPPVSAPGYIDARIGTSIRLFSYKNAHVYLKADIYNLFNQNICMYKSNSNVYYYGPRIHFMTGIFVKYNMPEKEKV